MQDNKYETTNVLVKYLIITLICLASSLLTACVSTGKPIKSVCIVRIDWADEALDNLNDHNKMSVLILSDYCDALSSPRVAP